MADTDEINNNSLLTIPEHVLHRRVGSEVLILSLADDEYYNLEGTAAAAFTALQSPQTLGDVISSLAVQLAVSRMTLEADMRSFVAELRACGLVEVGQVAID